MKKLLIISFLIIFNLVFSMLAYCNTQTTQLTEIAPLFFTILIAILEIFLRLNSKTSGILTIIIKILLYISQLFEKRNISKYKRKI